jgi:uncharacterized membrane protein YiaA
MLESKAPFESKTFKRTYLVGTVIVLVGMWAASALILSGTPYFAQMLPVLLSGMFWFIVVVPGAFFWTRPESKQPLSKEKALTIIK